MATAVRPSPASPPSLVATWRERATVIERYAPEVATALRDCAQELEQATRAEALDTVTVAEAAILSGYTPDAIGKMIARGDIPNYGNKRRPRIRRVDVPRKPGHARGADMTLLALGAS